MNPPHAGPTHGLVTDLASFYRGLDPNWNRLAIIGSPGSGKTAAMTLLLLSILQDREEGEPVPVWITLGGWNPNAQSLRDYAATIIGRDFPATRAPSAGGKAGPTALLDARQVALFLDGLDEMPAELQAEGTRLIHQERTLPIVMTSRADEYANATTQTPFDGAVIQLIPLSMEQTIAALKIGHKGDRAVIWERFTDRLVHWPTESRLWSSPLIVSLLRQAYETTGDPCELLGGDRAIPTDGAVQAALIEHVLHQGYPDPTQRDHALYWLTWIAQKLDGTRDIRWWEIPQWTPRLLLTRNLLLGLMTGLMAVVMAVTILVGGPEPLFSVWLGWASGLGIMMVAGKSTEFLEEHEPRSVWISRLSGRESIIIGLWGMAFSIAGIGLGVLHSWWVKSEFLWAFLGLMFGLSAVSGPLVFTFSKPLKESIAATPALSYRSDLRFGIFSGFGLGVGFGGIFGVMMTWVATGAWSSVENPVVTEFEAGFSIGPGFGIGATLGSGILLGIWARPSWRVRIEPRGVVEVGLLRERLCWLLIMPW